MHQSYAAFFVAVSFLAMCLQHPSSLQDGFAVSASGRGPKLWDLIHWKTSLQPLLIVEESAWSVCSVTGLCLDVRSKGSPVQAQNFNAAVFSSGDWQLQTPRWRVPLPAACESCSDIANPFGSRARLAHSARWLSRVPELLLQWKKSFCSLIPLCSPYISGMVSCQGLELGRNYNAKVFWRWVSRDCRFCVGANGPEGFLLPVESLPVIKNIVYLVTAQHGSWRCSLAASPPTWAGQDRTHLHPFSPLVIYHVLWLPKRADLQSSGPHNSVAHSPQEPVASSFLLVFPPSARCS